MDAKQRQRMQAVAVVRNERLAQLAKRPKDVGYHEGFADGVKACMLLEFYEEGKRHDEKWLWLKVKAVVDAIRPFVKRT